MTDTPGDRRRVERCHSQEEDSSSSSSEPTTGCSSSSTPSSAIATSYAGDSGGPRRGASSDGVRSLSSARLGAQRSDYYGGLVHGRSMPALDHVDTSRLSRFGALAGDSAQPPANEKQLLQELNERSAGYIATVRGLEQSNTDLDEEISALKRRRSAIARSGVNDVHELEIKELRELIDHVRGEKMSMQMEQKRLNNDIKKLNEEYGQEIRLHN
ncbi:unnamed protein product [Lampetra planeri]